MTRLKVKIALVTGASSGIGEATAERLAQAGYKVYGTSRRGAQAGRQSFEMLPLDVTSDESVAAAVGEVMRRDGRIDLLVNIGSVLGFLPMPYGALYAATKHAVEGYSESLDHELRTRGIRVSVIEPAYTKTPFDANFLEPDAKLDAYRDARVAVNKRVKEVMETADGPAVVADVVLKAAGAANPRL